MTDETTSGAELRAEREACNVLAYELAIQMRVASSRVSQIEALAQVTPETVRRYRTGLAVLSSPVATTTPAEPSETR